MLRMNNFKQILPKCLILAVLICMFGSMLVYAKYIYTETLSGQITITAHLGNIQVDEHVVAKNSDGSYSLTEQWISEKYYAPNVYVLIPGLDVPKDPVVKISNKSHLDAYVFVKVVTNISDPNLSYALTNNWKQIISSTDGNITTTVYAYTAGTANPVTIDNSFGTNGSGEIPVLVSDLFEVKEGLNLTSDVYLNFYAYMGQAIPDKEPLYVYQTLFTT